jgi:hypothetical protein
MLELQLENKRQLLMIFTITAQCRSKGMITASVVGLLESKVHRANQKSGHHFIYLDNDNIQRQMNKKSGFNAEQIEKG